LFKRLQNRGKRRLQGHIVRAENMLRNCSAEVFKGGEKGKV